jgi:dihydroxy-acid dehydratase
VSPESYVGGPLALVRDGDLIELDVPARKLNVLISDEEMSKRKSAWQAPSKKFDRGFGKMYSAHVLQADQGCDFDFLETSHQEEVGTDPEIH